MEIFEGWFEKTFIPAVKARRVLFGLPDRWALLLVDGHKSRLSEKAVKALTDAKIQMLLFVPHASHVGQPLDLVIFAGFQADQKKNSSKYRKYDRDVGIAIATQDAIHCLQKNLTDKNIASAFEKAGLVPLVPSRVLNCQYVPRVPQDEVNHDEQVSSGRTGITIGSMVLTSAEGEKIVKELASKRKAKQVAIEAALLKKQAKEAARAPKKAIKKRRKKSEK